MYRCKSLVPPDDGSVPSDVDGPNLLQLTSSTFFVPAALCVAQGRLAGVFIYCSNAVCSIYVHRPDRTTTDNAGDILDHLFVFSWVVYNAVLLFSTWPPLWAYALACSGIVFCAKIWTRFLKYRSLQRYGVHSCMHLFGAFGSLLLLL